MKTIIKDERQIKLQQAALNVIPDKTHLRLINAHYSCGECYAAWFGPPVCISCGKKTFVIASNLYSEQGIFDVF